jgi:type III restriction enzyme
LKIYEIDFGSQHIELTNGVILAVGQSQGGMNDEVMKFMIRKTVEEHLRKEKQFHQGYQSLSLFFIDKKRTIRSTM